IFLRQREGDAAVLNSNDLRVKAMRTNPGVKRLLFDGRETLRELKLSLRVPTLRGAHNAENAAAACLLARHLGAAADALQRGLDTYPGLPHRLEPIRVLDGVEWINDSKATNVDSVEKSLSAFQSGVIIIMGGRGKGAPYAPLKPLLRERAKAILTIGEDADKIAAELGPVQACGTLASAV